MNTSMLERSRTMRAAPTLRRRKPPISAIRALLEPRELCADQAVAVDVHAADRLRDADAGDRVVEVDQGQLLRHPHERRAVEADEPTEPAHGRCDVPRLA